MNEKIRTIYNKIGLDKAQYNLDRPTVKISALSSGNVDKYEFLTSEDVLLEKGLLKKAATIKRFEYSSLGSELKSNWQTGIAKDQYKLFKDNINVNDNNRKDDVKHKMVSRQKMVK